MREFVFLLLDKFSMIAFSAAIEPLRAANRMLETPQYSWRIATAGGGVVSCSNGVKIMADISLEEIDRSSLIIVCGGIDIHLTTTKPVLTWLRKQARRGVGVGALCTGAWTLAKAGLLNDVPCTIHWENRESFRRTSRKLSSPITIMSAPARAGPAPAARRLLT